MNQRRVIFISMLLAAMATSVNLASKKDRPRDQYWRVWIATPVATFLLLTLDAFGAGELAAAMSMTTAVAAIIGGKGVADIIVNVLGGKAATGAKSPVLPTTPSATTTQAQVAAGNYLFIPPGQYQPLQSPQEGVLT